MKERIKLAVCAFFILLPWIFFDIDLGDAAYHSLSSWMMAFHPKMPPGELPLWFEQVPVWFSYFVDSLWWKVIGRDASILAGRFGWLLFQVFMSLGLYEAFRRLFPGLNVVGALLLGLLAVNCGADDFVLSYYVVPPALGSLAFAFLVVALKERTEWKFALLSGGFAVLATQSRLPSTVPVVAAFLVIFASDFWLRGDREYTLRVVRYFLAGVLLGVLMAVTALYFSGQAEYFAPGLRSFWQGVAGATNQRYSKGLVLQRAVGHYLRIAIGLAIFFPVVVALERLERKRLARALFFLLLVLLIPLAIAKYGTVLAVVIGGSACLILRELGKSWRALVSWQISLAIGAFACLAAFTLGTFLEGIQTFKYGLWILVPSALLLYKGQDRWARAWLPGVIWVLFVVNRVMWPTFPYLERPIYRMTAAAEVEAMRGLRTYPRKALALTELVTKLQALGLKEGDELLVYAAVPTYYPIAGIYLLTRTVPLFHDPGIVEYPGSRWPRHKRAIEEAAAQMRLPRFVVRQKQALQYLAAEPKNLLTRVWTFEPASAPVSFGWTTGEKNGIAGEMDELLQSVNYAVVWENDYFVVLANR